MRGDKSNSPRKTADTWAPESIEGLVFQRSVLGLSTLVTNVKLFDFFTKTFSYAYLHNLIHSTHTVVDMYLLTRAPWRMRRQEEDFKTSFFQLIILDVEKGKITP